MIGQLEAHRAAAGGEYVALFGDRLLQAKAWMADLERGVALTPYRREGLLDLEHVADPKLRGGPYRVPFLEEGSRFRLASLRVVRGAEAYVVADAGGAEGPAYTQLSVEGCLTRGAAEKALAAGAWTLKQADKKRRLHRELRQPKTERGMEAKGVGFAAGADGIDVKAADRERVEYAIEALPSAQELSNAGAAPLDRREDR